MTAATSALIVAVVGVFGTLFSGVLAHRGGLRSKAMELDHAERQRQAERVAQERRESVAERKASYTAFNHQLRQVHMILWQHCVALQEGRAGPGQTEEREEPRRALRAVYAEAQLVVSDDVLVAGGGLVHRLNRIHTLLSQHERRTDTEESLEDIRERLGQTSENLYEVRQTMRKDLGITTLPVTRPDGYGVE